MRSLRPLVVAFLLLPGLLCVAGCASFSLSVSVPPSASEVTSEPEPAAVDPATTSASAAIAPVAGESRFAGKTVVITGANRGLGLEFVKQYMALGADVVGTARRPDAADELAATGAKVVQLDVTDDASVAAFDGPVHLLVIPVSPGWVRTDMGGPDAELSPEESIGGLVKVIEGLDRERSGLFINHDGRLLEW